MIPLLLFLLAPPGPLVEGNPQSTVRVLIYEDLQCSDCADLRKMLDAQLLPRYAATVAFEHRDFPLPKHKWARDAAVAARWFQQQKIEIAVEWRRELMANQKSITVDSLPDRIRAFASRNGLDPAAAIMSLKDESLRQAVESDYQDGVARGIAHTPTALVNGEPFIETFTFEQISGAIERELKAGQKQ